MIKPIIPYKKGAAKKKKLPKNPNSFPNWLDGKKELIPNIGIKINNEKPK
jgi:hypothetical protein